MTEEAKTLRPRFQTASLVMLLVDVIALVGLLFFTTVVAPKFRQIFADLLEGRPLPALTHGLLAIPVSVYLLCIVAAIVGLVCKESRINDKRQTLAMNVGAFVTVAVLFVVLVIALYYPLITIIESLRT